MTDAIQINMNIRDMDAELELEEMANEDGNILVIECE